MGGHLEIRTFGGLRILRAGETIVGISSRKVEALFIFLALTERPQPREVLADLLWDDRSQQQAMANLRRVLTELRKHFSSYVDITRNTAGLVPESELWLDVRELQSGVALLKEEWDRPSSKMAAQVQAGIDLYQGDFLAGFYVRGASGFEAWLTEERAHWQQVVLEGAGLLSSIYEKSGKLPEAIALARRILQIDPLDEAAHRRLMSLLVASGQRSAALQQYEVFRRVLQTELGVEPSPKTKVLYDRIRDVELGTAIIQSEKVRGYELQEEIGAGAFGVVYRAIQPSVGREVAVKIIQPQFANHPDFIRRFEAEAQMVARLEHPHIVPLYDYWRGSDGAFLVTRWLRGGNLQNSLAQGPWELEAAARLMDQIAGALASAHQQGVVHRDIKPANILLDEDRNGYLSDFGIAKDITLDVGMTETGVMVGSPAYVSPEQALNEKITHLSDIYSLGVVLYELLTGVHPFPDIVLAALIQKHLHESFPAVREKRPDLPGEIDQIIQRATAKNPSERFPDVLAVAVAVREVASGVGRIDIVPAAGLVNPYKGLRSFQEADAADFFGRESLTKELLEQLTRESSVISKSQPSIAGADGRFLAVVGPSGSGKSSVVKAGVVPALRRGEIDGSQNWFIVEIMPGNHPLEELEAGLLRIAVNPPATLLSQLQEDKRGLVRAVKRVLSDNEDTELLLVIDQFEELFTLVEDKDERYHFLNSLYEAVVDQRSRVRVILTLRADFYDRPLRYPDLGELVRHHTTAIVPMNTDELERAIQSPAEKAGVAVEPELLLAIIRDVKEQPGALPLLQYTLMELFERRQGHTMTMAAYDEMGGVLGALGNRAEEIYSSLNETGQETTRQLFLRLVTLGEGIEGTRRHVLRSELEALREEGGSLVHRSQTNIDHPQKHNSQLSRVIDSFGRYRLLTFDRHPATRGPTVEVAHEALVREWERLRSWLEESRHDIRMQRLLAHAALEWEGAQQDSSYLLQGARMDQFTAWSSETDLALTQTERAYLDASLAERRYLESIEEEREAHEAMLEQRSRRFLRTLVGVFAIAAVVSFLLAAIAFNQRSIAQNHAATATVAQGEAIIEAATAAAAREDAEDQRAIALVEAEQRATAQAQAVAEVEARATAQSVAEEQRHVAERQASIGLGSQAVLELAGSFPERGALLALEALDNFPYTWQAERALGQAVFGNHLRLALQHGGWINNTSWSPDGKRIATASDDGTAKVWDASTGEMIFSLDFEDWVPGALWSPSGDRILIPAADGTTSVWDMASGDLLLTLGGHAETVYFADWSPSGNQILTTSSDKTARIWDAFSGEELHVLTGHEDWVFACSTRGYCSSETTAWSPFGDRILTRGFDNLAIVWDALSGEELLRLSSHQDRIRSALWSHVGDRILTASYDQTAKVWDAETGEELVTLVGHEFRLNGALWSPNDDRILTFSWDNTARVWDAVTGEELVTFDEHNQIIWAAAWSPSGDLIVTGSGDNTAKVWDPVSGEELLTFFGHTAPAMDVKWSPSGEKVITTGPDGLANVWSIPDEMELIEISGDDGGGLAAGWSPDGERVARGYLDGRVKIFDAATGKEVLEIQAHQDNMDDLAWSPTSDYLLTTGWDGTAKVWDATNGDHLVTFSGHVGSLSSGSWSPDATKIATTGAEDATVKVWDAATGEVLLTFSEHEGQIDRAEWSPDGTRIASVSRDMSAMVWDAASGQVLLDLYPENFGSVVLTLAWSADGSRIVTFADDGLLRVWDTTSGEELSSMTGHGGDVFTISWFPSGERILSADSNGFVKVWDATNGTELFSVQIPNNGGVWLAPGAGRFLANASPNGPLRIFSIWGSLDELIDLAEECCIIRELTVEERELFGLPEQ